MPSIAKFPALLVCSLMVVSMCLAVPASAAMNWTHEHLDHRDSTGFMPSIELDAAGNPLIAYGTYYGANYTYKSGGSWATEVISTDNVQSMDMAMTSNGEPRVAYAFGSFNTEGIAYASRSGTAWTVETALNNTRVLAYTPLVLDSANRPYILYQEWYSHDIRLAHKNTGSWTNEPVTAQGGWERIVMDIDDSDTLHIVYENSTANQIIHGTRAASGGVWQFTSLASGSIGAGNIDIKIAPDGEPRVIWGLTYFTFDGSSWSSETLTSPAQYSIDWQSLTFDNQGNPHLANFQSYQLYYGTNPGTGWQTLEMVLDENAGWGCSIAVSNPAQVHIAHYNANWDNLTYTIGAPGTGGTDTDSDGLPDIWEMNNFGNLDQDGTDDPDGDGFDNSNEQVNDTDPNDPNDPPPNDPDRIYDESGHSSDITSVMYYQISSNDFTSYDLSLITLNLKTETIGG